MKRPVIAARAAARESKARWWLRLDGYWAQLSAFLADAVTDLERAHPEAYVELSPQFGEARSRRGGGLASRVANGEIDLQYNRARYYDWNTGRWISQDPIGFDAGDGNLYRYVKNGPVFATDPTGEVPAVPTKASTFPWLAG